MPSDPDNKDSNLYAMSGKTRLVLWWPRILLGVVALWSLFLLAIPAPRLLKIVLGVLLPVWPLLIYATGRSIAAVVTRAVFDGSNIHFTRWDRRETIVPRRGRALKKNTGRTNSALLFLQTNEDASPLAFLKQDTEAMELIADLEKRGVVRGPGAPKERLTPQQMTQIR